MKKKVSVFKAAKAHSKFHPKAQGMGNNKGHMPMMPKGKMTWGG